MRRCLPALLVVLALGSVGAAPAVASPAAHPAADSTAQPAARAAALPAKQLTGYWQNFVNPATSLKLADVPDAYDLIVLAFAGADTTKPGAVTFGVDPELSSALGGYSDADLKSDIAAKKAAGKSVILSIGGQNGSVDLSSAANVSNFVDSFAAIAQDWGIQGLDIDLENGLNVANTTSAVQQLRTKLGDGFLLTMAPQTIDVQPGGGYLQLIENVKDLVTVVHPQYYNSGSMNGCDGSVVAQGGVDFITAQACYLLKTLRPEQVALGLPATSSAAGSGYVAPSVITSALDCLAARTSCGKYTPDAGAPAIGGVMTWSINWDVTGGRAFSDAVRSHLDAMG